MEDDSMLAGLRRVCLRCVTAAVVGVCLCAGAQGQAQISDAALLAELQTLSQRAGVVLVGQIVAIERHPGYVAVAFRVEQPVRGLTGSRFVMREWSGLWAPGAGRYVLGQRVLAFVYGPGHGGLSSPVSGSEGLVPIAVQGADKPELLDIRRVAASVVRSPAVPLPTEDDGAFCLGEVLEFLRGQRSAASLVRVPLPGSMHPARAHLPSAIVVGKRPLPVQVNGDFGTPLPPAWGGSRAAR